MNNIIECLVGDALLLEIQKKYKKGFARKIQLNAFKLKPMTSGTLVFNEFLQILKYHVYKNE